MLSQCMNKNISIILIIFIIYKLFTKLFQKTYKEQFKKTIIKNSKDLNKCITECNLSNKRFSNQNTSCDIICTKKISESEYYNKNLTQF